MEKDKQEIIEELLRAYRNKRLHPGLLMAPEELRKAVRDRSGPESQLAGWFLCGTAHPSMFSACAQNVMHSALMAFGTRVLVILQQCQNWQSRLVLPITGDKAKRFVDALRRGEKLQLSLANGDKEEAVVSLLGPTSEELLCAMERFDPHSEDTADNVLQELPRIVCALLQPAALKTLNPSEDVKQVCVSFILPPEAPLEWLPTIAGTPLVSRLH